MGVTGRLNRASNSGRPAAFLRGFKAGYFAILYNFIVLGWVLNGLGKVAEAVLGVDPQVAVIVGALHDGRAEGLQYAQKLGIFTTSDYSEIYQLENLQWDCHSL